MLRKFESHAGSFDILVILGRGISYRTEISYELRLDVDIVSDTLTFLKELALIEQVPYEEGQKKTIRYIRLTAKGERVAKALAEVEKALGGH